MIHIDVTLTPTELETKSPCGSLAVLIDVVRATTTITTALANGCSFILPVLHVEEAFQRKEQEHDSASILLGGERGGKRVEGFDLGNSPADYTQHQGIIFSTSNGTRTLLALDGAAQILVGSFLNVSALCEEVKQYCESKSTNTQHNILIACSGVANTFSLEDAVCAGMITNRLSKLLPELTKSPAANAVEILYTHYRSDLLTMLKQSDGGRKLIPIGLEDDLSDCAVVDKYSVVPHYSNGKIML